MSRHRNIRSMNYSDEYDGYDDVYGHSVEDDYCVSPSQAAFMYDREGTKDKQKIGAFFERDNDIAEENEEVESKETNLSDIDRARLETCIEHIKQNVNITSSRQNLIDKILLCNFNVEKALKLLLDNTDIKDNKQEKDLKFSLKTTKGFTIPKLNTKLSSSPVFTNETKNYTSLADLTSHHLNKVGLTPNSGVEELITEVVHTVSSINLNDPPKPIKSLNFLQSHNGLSSNWHIDLTRALRITKSAPQIHSISSPEEQFVPQFVDCERAVPELKTERNDCCMDISWISKVKMRISKKPSQFAKIVCARYRAPNASIKFDDVICNSRITPFAFDTPSPDDLILKSFKRI